MKLRDVFSIVISLPIIAMLPMVIVVLIFMPLIGVLQIIEIMRTGFSHTPAVYCSLLFMICFVVSLSLQLRYARKIYVVFPWLYHFVEFLTIVAIFICLSHTFINWSYEKIDTMRNTLGNIGAVGILILLRVFLSVYYYKKPMVNLIEEQAFKMTKYES